MRTAPTSGMGLILKGLLRCRGWGDIPEEGVPGTAPHVSSPPGQKPHFGPGWPEAASATKRPSPGPNSRAAKAAGLSHGEAATACHSLEGAWGSRLHLRGMMIKNLLDYGSFQFIPNKILTLSLRITSKNHAAGGVTRRVQAGVMAPSSWPRRPPCQPSPWLSPFPPPSPPSLAWPRSQPSGWWRCERLLCPPAQSP